MPEAPYQPPALPGPVLGTVNKPSSPELCESTGPGCSQCPQSLVLMVRGTPAQQGMPVAQGKARMICPPK